MGRWNMGRIRIQKEWERERKRDREREEGGRERGRNKEIDGVGVKKRERICHFGSQNVLVLLESSSFMTERCKAMFQNPFPYSLLLNMDFRLLTMNTLSLSPFIFFFVCLPPSHISIFCPPPF